jgi:hypothetical protein
MLVELTESTSAVETVDLKAVLKADLTAVKSVGLKAG